MAPTKGICIGNHWWRQHEKDPKDPYILISKDRIGSTNCRFHEQPDNPSMIRENGDPMCDFD